MAANRPSCIVAVSTVPFGHCPASSIIAFTKDGLSVINTRLDTPLMLGSYTLVMCTESWGMSSYARAIVELRADVELKDTIMVVVPKFVGYGYTMRTIHVEYEWTPP
ncbi:hypothetical protein Tco_0064662 [Tanacetum coccineum]